ncbi:MAG: histidinol dehydrogenase, partial [Alistipes sp.]|nr:histidinol dehydrogenase [Alistipes sp.]
MNLYINPAEELWGELCCRAEQNNDQIRDRVAKIIARVESERDEALFALAKEIDGVELQSLRVSDEEFRCAESKISAELKQAIAQAISNIEKFHRAQMPRTIEVETMPGVRCIQRPVSIERVGLYIPGGTAPLFSTVLMLAVPARVAGCRKVILCTPTNKQGEVAAEVLYAAKCAGVEEIYKVGGAQAVAAMALGT